MFFIVNHKHKVLIGWSPKCGCTTIKEYYLETIGIKRKNKVEVHHDPDVQQHVHHSVLKKQDLNKLDKYRKVFLIRNPYKRVISGYLQRIVMNKTLYDTRFREKDYANDGKINTFNKFIDTMINNRKHIEDNHHFDQQCTHNYNVFQNRKWKWDFVMDLDNLDHDIVRLNKMLNTNVKLNEMNKVKHTEIHVEKAYDLTIKQLLALDGMPSYESFFNEQIADKIAKIYKLDMDNFKKWGHQYKVPVRKPQFIIAGTQKGGTVALMENLNKHPDIHVVDEPHFFDDSNQFRKGFQFYESLFKTPKKIAGEKTPDYMYFPHVIDKIHAYDRNVKLIICLRDPIKRAYSQYNMSLQLAESLPNCGEKMMYIKHFYKNGQPMTFTEVLQRDIEKMKEPRFFCDCIRKGFYDEQLLNIYKKFPKENVLVVISERMRKNFEAEYNKILRFIGAKQVKIILEPEQHVRTYEKPITKKDYELLKKMYDPHNRNLFKLLGYNINEWHVD